MFDGYIQHPMRSAGRIRRPMRLRRIWWLLWAGAPAAAAGLLATTVHAQTLSEEEIEEQGLATQPQEGAWSITVGPGLAVRPIYPGASDDRLRFVPMFLIRYGDTFFLGTGGLGMNLIRRDGFRAGPVLGYEGGRKAADDPQLYGLGDISASLTAGGFVSYDYGPWQIYGTARQAITHTGNGLTAFVRLDYRAILIPGTLMLSVGPEISLADGAANRTWFGISSDQSLQSGLPVFSPGGGFRDVGLHAVLTYRLSDHILLHAFGQMKELTGDVANSPIVKAKTQSLAGLGIAYHF